MPALRLYFCDSPLELIQPLGCFIPLPRCRTLGSRTLLQPLAASSFLELLLFLYPCYLLSGISFPFCVPPLSLSVSFPHCLCPTPVFSLKSFFEPSNTSKLLKHRWFPDHLSPAHLIPNSVPIWPTFYNSHPAGRRLSSQQKSAPRSHGHFSGEDCCQPGS